MDRSCLKRRGLHLNRKESSLLGRNFLCHTSNCCVMQASVSSINLYESGFSKVKCFKMAMLNIVSLPTYINEIRLLLATSKFDILAINETRMDQSISDDFVSIPNYDILRFDCNRLTHNLTHITTENLEDICIEAHRPYTLLFIIATLNFVSSICNFKRFSWNRFLDDLSNQPWDHIDHEINIDRKWSLWKSLFLDILDKHAPLKLKRIRSLFSTFDA